MYENYQFQSAVLYYFYRFVLPLCLAELITFAKVKKKSYWGLRLSCYRFLYLSIACIRVFFNIEIKFGWFRTIFLSLFLLSLVPLILTFDLKIKQVLFLATSAYTIQNFTDNLWQLRRKWVPSSDKLYVELLLYFSSIAFSFVLYYFVFVKLLKKNQVVNLSSNSVLFVSLASILVVNFLSRYAQQCEDYVGYVSSKLYARIACFFVLAIQYNIFHPTKLNDEKVILEQTLKFQNEKFASSKENRDLINIKIHDLKHALSSIDSNNLTNEQQATLKSLSDTVISYDSTVKTGNPVIDRVFSEKAGICKREKIRLSLIIDGSLFSFMDNADIYSLFENILENAIKAVKKEEESKRSIFISAVKKNDIVSIKEENYSSSNIQFENGLPLTSEEGIYHGYGVKSIDYIAKKYGGRALFEQKDKIFSVFVCFFPASEKEKRK